MSSLEDISSLRIKGGIFETETDLPLLKKDKQIPRFSLLYGKNGTGKSTIAKAVRKLTGFDEKQINSAEFVDDNNTIISMEKDITTKSIYVYNEDFVDENIRIDGDGLDTIVVMGAAKNADDEIKILKPDYDKSVEAVTKQEEKLANYYNPKNESCPDFYLEEMVMALKGDNNWSGRDAKILGKRTNSQVKKETYKQFIELKPRKTRDELIVEYDYTYKKFDEAKNGSKIIEKAVPKLKPFVDSERDVGILLAEKIEKPKLTEREKILFEMLQEEGGVKN